jgi:hypothetical protein
MMLELATSAYAQSLTPDPGAWRPMSYADLQKPSPHTATYLDIWKDAIEVNNRAYRARGDQRFSDGNAPATEAHFVIWSSTKSVVLSILNTVTGCTLKELRVRVDNAPPSTNRRSSWPASSAAARRESSPTTWRAEIATPATSRMATA